MMLWVFCVVWLGGFGKVGVVFGVGHAHIDAAWLWPFEESRRKVLRTGVPSKHPTLTASL